MTVEVTLNLIKYLRIHNIKFLNSRREVKTDFFFVRCRTYVLHKNEDSFDSKRIIAFVLVAI